MPLDPSIISNAFADVSRNMPDMNALMQQRVRGAENIYQIETGRQEQAAQAEQEAAKAQEDAAFKALLPAYTYGIQTGDMAGALNLVPPEMQESLAPYVDALTGKSPQEVQAALIGSLSSSPMGQEALSAIQRGQTFGVQQGQLDVSRERLAFDREKAAAEAAGGGVSPDTAARLEFDREKFAAEQEEKAKLAASGGVTGDKQQAREGVDGTLSRIMDQYKVLKEEKAIVSTKNTAAENIQARISTKLGTSVGRTVGTKAQSARDTIANLRQALLADIKAATGMSSKAIDSNVELKSFLDSLGDPDQSLETIQGTLAELSIKYGLGNLSVDGAEPPPAVAPAALPEGATTTNW